MSIFDKTIDTLNTALDMQLIRHSVISNNIANAETPHYKSRRVEFEETLQKAVEANDSGIEENALSSVRPVIFEDYEADRGQDLNTVDMDREMADLTKNDLKYSAGTEAIARKFALLKYTITEGSR